MHLEGDQGQEPSSNAPFSPVQAWPWSQGVRVRMENGAGGGWRLGWGQERHLRAGDGVSASPGPPRRQRSFPEGGLQQKPLRCGITLERTDWDSPVQKWWAHLVPLGCVLESKCQSSGRIWPQGPGSSILQWPERYSTWSFVKATKGFKCDSTHNMQWELSTVHFPPQHRAKEAQAFSCFSVRNCW